MLNLLPVRPCSRHNPLTKAPRLLLLSSQVFTRQASGPSRWKQRQGSDVYARDAKVKGLKSRAAFKLLEVSESESSLVLDAEVCQRVPKRVGERWRWMEELTEGSRLIRNTGCSGRIRRLLIL